MPGTQYDDMNAHDIQAVLDNAAGVIKEVEQGSTDYSPEDYQHAQDTQRELADVMESRPPIRLTGSNAGVMQTGTFTS